MDYDVICVGSVLLDIYLKSGAFEKETGVRGEPVMCIEYGGKTEANEVEVTSGGGGSNNAVAFARKGFTTALIAEMGTDLVAATIKEELRREGVDLSMLVEEANEETGISSILVAPDGGRSVAVYRGASKMLTKEDVRWDEVRAGWLYLSSLGGEMALLEGLIGHAKAKGIKIVVNPGAGELEKIGAWGGEFLFEGTEVLLLNREEAEKLYAVTLTDELWASEWRPRGGKYVVITDGRNGGRVYYENQKYVYEPTVVAAVEETGAGDAFGSGLTAALMLGKPIEVAVEWGKKQAASVVSYMGAKRGLLTREQIEKTETTVGVGDSR